MCQLEAGMLEVGGAEGAAAPPTGIRAVAAKQH